MDAPADATPRSAIPLSGRWSLGGLVVDFDRAQAFREGCELRLDRASFELLRCLMAQAGETLSKETLLRAGWPGRVVSENSLAKAIGKLRAALDDPEGERLRVVHGYGYRLLLPLEHIEPSRVEPAPAAIPADAAGADADTTTRPGAPIARRLGRAAWVGAVLCMLALAAALSIWTSKPTDLIASPALDAGVAAPAALDVVAVLPLRDLSEDGRHAVFATGLANHLRDQLQRVPKLRVVPRAPSERVRDAVFDPAALGPELGANLLVGGSIATRGDRLRIELRLVDTEGRTPGWTEVFERAPYDQATLIDAVTARLLDGIGGQPERWGHDPARGRGTANEAAYRTFLRASTLFAGNNDPNSQRRTIAVLEEAIALDPDYADAWRMLAGILGGSGYYADSSEELLQGRARAFEAWQRTLDLSQPDPLDYLLLSETRLLYRFDYAGAWADLERAEALTPGGESAVLLVWKARLLASMGRLEDAVATGARAIALDPESGARRNQGWHYLALGDTRNARAVLLLQLHDLPENPHTNFYLALCDIFEARPQLALERLEHSSTLFRLVGTAIALHELGDRAGSDAALDALSRQFGVADGYWVGAVHAWRGESDLAFEWIKRATRGGDSSVMYLPFDPLLAKLREDTRYADALKAIGYPPSW
ncbi:MAG: winged helix-turn-helix domain-containing protein [Xanthomonadales bacterium]|nr:winged helix-turn-helix domain-containing protein [Xanthomonadales bacterium]